MRKTIREHIIFKIVTLLIATSLLTPTVTKFTHLFAHHEHDICLGEKSTHLHELNVDCDFYKYQVHHNYTFTCFNYDHLFTPQEFPLKVVSQYQFLSEYQRLQTTLRGPPSLI